MLDCLCVSHEGQNRTNSNAVTLHFNSFMEQQLFFSQYVIRAGQVVCMDDYEKEYFMVQGFAAAAGSGPGGPGSLLPGAPSSEFSQDGSQGKDLFKKDCYVILKENLS